MPSDDSAPAPAAEAVPPASFRPIRRKNSTEVGSIAAANDGEFRPASIRPTSRRDSRGDVSSDANMRGSLQSSDTLPVQPRRTSRRASNAGGKKKAAGPTRRASNELAASIRLDQLRQLRGQLSVMIQDAKMVDVLSEPLGSVDDSVSSSHRGGGDEETGSMPSAGDSLSRDSLHASVTSAGSSTGEDKDKEALERSPLLAGQEEQYGRYDVSDFDLEGWTRRPSDLESDLESGLESGPTSAQSSAMPSPSALPVVYRPKRKEEFSALLPSSVRDSSFDADATPVVAHRSASAPTIAVLPPPPPFASAAGMHRRFAGRAASDVTSSLVASSELSEDTERGSASNVSFAEGGGGRDDGSLVGSNGGTTAETERTTGSESALDSSISGRMRRWSSRARSKDRRGSSASMQSAPSARSGSDSTQRQHGGRPGGGIGRSPSRSLSRARQAIGASVRNFGKGRDGAGLDASTRSVRSSARSRRSLDKSHRTSMRMMPNYDFLSKDGERGHEDQGKSQLIANAKWWHGVFVFSLISMLACIITLWAPYPVGARMPTAQVAQMPWSDGCQGLDACICPRETICADDLISMIFLTIARCTAWFDYPLYMLLFLSKANNLNNFLQKTALRCWINFSDYHRVHSLFGMIVGVESACHTFFHVLRWARRNNDIQLLWTSRTGVTGLVAMILCPFIVLPMTVPYLKKRMKFEWRKGLHYLSVVWGAALMCHAPQRIFWLVGVPLMVYGADKIAEAMFKTHLVESAHFQRLGDTSCIISFENPPGFGKQNSAYVYLMLPWLSKSQFHAFTVFPCTKKDHSSICIHKCGDWTGKLMKAITTPSHKPAFVVGPFLSPFSSPAMDSENLVAVASGIGVTPAISLIKQYSSTSRRLNLVWICRDAGLVEHFLQNVVFGSDGYTLIYYTGKDRGLILQEDLPANVFIYNGRPNLERTIGGIIASIATGEGLPEDLSKKVLTRAPAEVRSRLLLEKALSIYTMDQLFEYTAKASRHGDGDVPLVAANYRGVMSTMRHLLGEDIDAVSEKITSNFEKVCDNPDCRIDREEFEFFFRLMTAGPGKEGSGGDDDEMASVKRGLERMNTRRDMFQSSRKNGSASNLMDAMEDPYDIKRHLQGDGKFRAKNWNLLYCGGSQPVLDQLNDFKRKFRIGLSVEKFDW